LKNRQGKVEKGGKEAKWKSAGDAKTAHKVCAVSYPKSWSRGHPPNHPQPTQPPRHSLCAVAVAALS